MSLFSFEKRKKVPDELPDLISDELEKESMNEVNSYLKEEIKKDNKKQEDGRIKIEDKKGTNALQELEKEKNVEENKRELNKNILNRLIKNVEDTPERPMKAEIRKKSFFDDFQLALSKEFSNVDSLESFYNKKFVDSDILDDMKNYWEKQKAENIIEVLGKSFQEKISIKIQKLQEIEGDWQKIYFELIEKEEEIKNTEEELKELLKEFVQLCKHKKESMDKRNGFKVKQNNKDNEKQKDKQSQKQK